MVTYLINGKKETFENEADAQAYIKALENYNNCNLCQIKKADRYFIYAYFFA